MRENTFTLAQEAGAKDKCAEGRNRKRRKMRRGRHSRKCAKRPEIVGISIRKPGGDSFCRKKKRGDV